MKMFINISHKYNKTSRTQHNITFGKEIQQQNQYQNDAIIALGQADINTPTLVM